MPLQLSAPEPLTRGHRVDAFDCGQPMLDEWLRKRPPGNRASGASRTLVVTDVSGRVLGCYALAVRAVAHETATSAVRQGMPDLVHVLGRRAVDRQAPGMKLCAARRRAEARRFT